MTYPGCCADCGFPESRHRLGGDAEFCGPYHHPTVAYLSKTSTVMHRVTVAFGGELFSETLDEPGVARRAILHKRDWEDFGSPETITVTVVAGDILNTKDSD